MLNTSICDDCNSSSAGPDHWKGTLRPSVHFGIGVYLVAIGIIAISGNGVMVFVLRKKKFRQPVNLFILNSLICNLIESIAGLPMTASSNISQRWLFDDAGCVFYGFLMYTCTLANLSTLTAIGIYRYIAIFYPEKEKAVKTSTAILKVLAGVWAYASFWSFLPLIGWGSYGPEPFKTSCAIQWNPKSQSEITYLFLMSAFVLVIPMVLISVFYFKIFRRTVLQIHSPVGCEPDVPSVTARLALERRKIQKSDIESVLTKIITANVVLFLLAWVPYGTLSFLSSCGVSLSHIMTALPCMFAKSQTIFTPIIYVCVHVQFRSELYESVGLRWKRTVRLNTPSFYKKKESSHANTRKRVYGMSLHQSVHDTEVQYTEATV